MSTIASWYWVFLDPLVNILVSSMFDELLSGYGSDSGFSSDICADYKSNATTPKTEKFSPNAILDDDDCAKLTRTKWTASFRKLIRRIKK